MSVCRWCHRLIWPWQRRSGIRRYQFHLPCIRAIDRMVERDSEITGI